MKKTIAVVALAFSAGFATHKQPQMQQAKLHAPPPTGASIEFDNKH